MSALTQDEGKKIHQAFEIRMGIERVEVAVLKEHVAEFEKKVSDVRPVDQKSLLEILKEFDGKIL